MRVNTPACVCVTYEPVYRQTPPEKWPQSCNIPFLRNITWRKKRGVTENWSQTLRRPLYDYRQRMGCRPLLASLPKFKCKRSISVVPVLLTDKDNQEQQWEECLCIKEYSSPLDIYYHVYHGCAVMWGWQHNRHLFAGCLHKVGSLTTLQAFMVYHKDSFTFIWRLYTYLTANTCLHSLIQGQI
jgi:hypothetical protein